MPEIFTRDKIVFQRFSVQWEPGQDVHIFAHYIKMTSLREIPKEVVREIPLNATRQNQMNMMRDQGIAFILNLEESTEL